MILSRLKYYWNRSATTIEWDIAFRKYNGSTILTNINDEFQLYKNRKGTWSADPFVFSYNNKTFLFFEMYLNDKRKGVIAVSEFDGEKFLAPQIAIEEDFHLSFPCIFTVGSKIYMIPETGAKRQIILYECKSFPNVWIKSSVLADGFIPSDVIIIPYNDNLYCLASILHGSACMANNIFYKLNTENKHLDVIKKCEIESENGVRNAGLCVEENGVLYRPGQNCEGHQYGKSLYFWKVIQLDDNDYKEEFVKEITVEDIKVCGEFSGIHTYNSNSHIEVIDLKREIKNNFLTRIKNMCFVIVAYIKHK